MSVNYFVNLTVGEINATYDIFYDTISNSTLATLTNGGGSASNLSFTQINSGILVSVPQTSTKIIIQNNGDCKDFIIFDIKPQVQGPTASSTLCMTFEVELQQKIWQFTSNGTENGRTKWEYTESSITYIIYWNSRLLRWEMEFTNNILFVQNSTSTEPIGAWQVIAPNTAGSGAIRNLQVAKGSCGVSAPLTAELISVNTSCKGTLPCDGKVSVVAAGGTPPYQYGYTTLANDTNSIVYQTSPIIENLCEGYFQIVIKDSSGTIITLPATVASESTPTTLTGTIELLETQTLIDNFSVPRQKQVEATWNLSYDTSIPIGVTLNATIFVTSTKKLGQPGNGNFADVVEVFKNNVLILPSNVSTTTQTIPRPFCSGSNIEETIQTYSYNISLSTNDRVKGYVQSNMTLTTSLVSDNNCATEMSQDITVSAIRNPNNPITGCQCCSVNYGKDSVSIIKEKITPDS